MRFATLWGEMRGFGVLYLLKKVIMENATTKTSSRKGKNLKFDQEWKDAVDRLPKHYRDEICAAIEAYQRDLTIIEVTPGVPRAIFMLIMPTIRRRYRARALHNTLSLHDALPILLNRYPLSHSLSFNNKNPAEASSTSCSAANVGTRYIASANS